MSDPVVYANFVSENAVANGTGSFALQGPSDTRFFSYSQKIAVGSLVGYVARQGALTEEGVGLLQSETILTRLYIIDSSATGISNNVDPGTPVQVSFDPTIQVQVWSAVSARLFISVDVDGNPTDPTPFRNALFVQSVTEMKAEEGLSDGEHVFVTANGLFQFDASDATLPDNVDTFRPDNYPAGLFKRVRLDIQGTIRGTSTIDAAAVGTGAKQRLYANPLAGTPNDYFEQGVDTANSAFDISSRFNQSDGLKKFITIFSPGTNADRVEARAPFTLASSTNTTGMKARTLARTSSALVLTVADALSNTAKALFKNVPLTFGGHYSGVYQTITALKAVGAPADGDTAEYGAAELFSDGEIFVVLGRAAVGDCNPFTVRWSSGTSTAGDDNTIFTPTYGAAATGAGRFLLNSSNMNVTLSASATPSVRHAVFCITSGATAITNLLNGHEGHIVILQRGDADIVVTHDPAKIDLGGFNVTLTADNPRLMLINIGGIWRSISSTAGAYSVNGVLYRPLSAKATEFVTIDDFKYSADTDYTNAFRRALDYFGNTGGVCWLPPKSTPYDVSGTERSMINHDKPVTFVAMGSMGGQDHFDRGSVCVRHNGASDTDLVWMNNGSEADTTKHMIGGGWIGVTFDFNGKARHTVRVSDVQRWNLDYCFIYGAKVTGLLIENYLATANPCGWASIRHLRVDCHISGSLQANCIHFRGRYSKTKSWVGNGSTTVYTFPYYVLHAQLLRVRVNGTDVPFTVAGTQNLSGCTVTLATAPANLSDVNISIRNTGVSMITLERPQMQCAEGHGILVDNGDGLYIEHPFCFRYDADGKCYGLRGADTVNNDDESNWDEINGVYTDTDLKILSGPIMASTWIHPMFGAATDFSSDGGFYVYGDLDRQETTVNVIDYPAGDGQPPIGGPGAAHVFQSGIDGIKLRQIGWIKDGNPVHPAFEARASWRSIPKIILKRSDSDTGGGFANCNWEIFPQANGALTGFDVTAGKQAFQVLKDGGVQVMDASYAFQWKIKTGTFTADRTLTITMGDVDRTLDLTAGTFARLESAQTFTATQTIRPASGNAQLNLRAATGSDQAILQYADGGTTRATISKNASSFLSMYAFGSGGTFLGEPLSYSLTDGAVFMNMLAGFTTASAANINITGGKLFVSTSSIRYKRDVEDVELSAAMNFVNNARPVFYRSKSQYDPKSWGYWGFIAEELAEVDPRLVQFEHAEDDFDVVTNSAVYEDQEVIGEDGEPVLNEDGTPQVQSVLITPETETRVLKKGAIPSVPNGVQYDRSVVLMTAALKHAFARIEALEGVINGQNQ